MSRSLTPLTDLVVADDTTLRWPGAQFRIGRIIHNRYRPMWSLAQGAGIPVVVDPTFHPLLWRLERDGSTIRAGITSPS